MRTITLLLFSVFATGCASVNSVSLTPVPPERTNPVRTQRDKLIFLGFNFDNDWINDTVEDLKRQCPAGKVTGVLTKDETVMYFLFFVYKKQLSVSGYCVPIAASSAAKKSSRGTASVEANEGLE